MTFNGKYAKIETIEAKELAGLLGENNMNMDVMDVIHQKMPEFSKGQKLIGHFIIDHYDKAAFMTASKLGMTVGVSESTVVRFASEVGFDGYPQLQKALQEMIRSRLTAVQRMEVTTEQIGSTDVLTKVLQRDIERIRKTMEETSIEDFNRAVKAIVSANRIYIVGVRSCASLVGFLSFYFNHIFPSVVPINTSSSSQMFEDLFRIDKGDVLIACSFPRYSSATINATKYARERGATVIAITDSLLSPLLTENDIPLLARSDMASFVDSLVAPLSLINALIVAVGMEMKDQISDTYSQLEKVWDAYDVYQKAKE